jgi:hypothetical protein
MDPPNVFWFAGTYGPMLIVGTLMVIVSGPILRAIWWKFAAALFAVGLSIRPPPGVTPA